MPALSKGGGKGGGDATTNLLGISFFYGRDAPFVGLLIILGLLRVRGKDLRLFGLKNGPRVLGA